MKTDQVSAAILAGGSSSRMGRDKALLELNGQTLLSIQVSRLRRAGVPDIMISGTDHPCPGARNIADETPHQGPLGGICACMKAARFPALLVLSVDVPLIAEETIRGLIASHEGGITVLEHAGRPEPLIAVHDCALAEEAERILRSDKRAVMRLFDTKDVKRYAYQGDERLLAGCNTPEEYARILASYQP